MGLRNSPGSSTVKVPQINESEQELSNTPETRSISVQRSYIVHKSSGKYLLNCTSPGLTLVSQEMPSCLVKCHNIYNSPLVLTICPKIQPVQIMSVSSLYYVKSSYGTVYYNISNPYINIESYIRIYISKYVQMSHLNRFHVIFDPTMYSTRFD